MNLPAGEQTALQMALKNRALDATAEGITITDCSLPNNPIIYANAGFERLTGYAADEILGKNCRFLQGPDTDRGELDKLREGIRHQRSVTVELLNYHKDGAPFWNRLSITPVRNEAGLATHFIGVQSDITQRKLAEASLHEANLSLQESNERMRRELEAAAQMQRSLLPLEPPRVPGFQFAWKFQPCDQLGGDMLDVYSLDDHSTGLYMLDVSGHGVSAALLSVTLSHWLSSKSSQLGFFEKQPEPAVAGQGLSPTQIATQLNLQFPMDDTTRQFFTLNYGILDNQSRQLSYVSAGHPPLILLSGDKPEIVRSEGFPVGIVAQPDYHERVLQFQPGDQLYLFSDGVCDTLNRAGEQFGIDRLADMIGKCRHQRAEESLQSILDSLDSWRQSRRLEDDLSLLVVEAKGCA
jgi:PAS domain S-box-containing protein